MRSTDNRLNFVPAPSAPAGAFWRGWGGRRGGGARRWAAGLAAGLAVIWSGAAQGQLVLTNAAGNIDVTKLKGNESDGVIALNPLNPAQMFIAANTNVEAGLYGAVSVNSGVTWSAVSLANLPVGAYPAVAWDGYGNLFLAYADGALSGIDVAASTNGGTNFNVMTNYANGLTNLASGDYAFQPRIAVGTGTALGSVWVLYKDFSLAFNPLVAQGAAVTGTNAFGTFGPAEIVPGSTNDCGFGDIAVGPQGQVMVVYQNLFDSAGTATNYVCVDADGLGPNTFGPPVVAATNAVGGNTTTLPAAPDGAGINAAAGLAWDTNPLSQQYGRVYLVCVGQGTDGNPADTAILLNSSIDNGATWSAQLQANDESTNSRFLPRVTVDPTDGVLALSWYDCRLDMGAITITNTTVPPNTITTNIDTNQTPPVTNLTTNIVLTTNLSGTADGIANHSAMMYATVSLDGGATFQANVNITSPKFTTNGYRAPYAHSLTDFGDYTGLAFYGGTFYPVWADNSGSGGGNPNGITNDLDITVAPVVLKGLADVSITSVVTNTTNVLGIGSVITYFLTASNAGPSAVTQALVTDYLPPEVRGGRAVQAFPTNHGVPGNYVINDHTLFWPVGALAVGGTATIWIEAPAVGIGSATNSATITPGPGVIDLLTNNNFTSLVSTVLGADLQLSITNSPAVIGYGLPAVTFTVTVSNQGPVTALGVYASNLLSANLVLTGVTLPPGGSYFTNAGENDVVVNIGTMTNGQVVSFGVTANVPLPPPFLGFGPATCTAIALGIVDPTITNNVGSAEVQIVPPDVAIGMAGAPAFVTVGDSVTYTLGVTNLGPVPAFGVTVTNFLPPNLQLVSVSVRKGAYTSNPDINTNGQTDIIATLNEPLLAGESSLVIITATAMALGQATNTAVVSNAVPDANPANNLARVVTPVDAPDVALIMTGAPGTITVGQTVTYTLTVTNSGPVRATSVALTNTLPAALAFAGVSLPVGMTYSTNQNVIVFNIGAMTNGQAATVSILATALSAGKATNSAVVGDTLPDGSFGNNSAKVVTTITPLAPFSNLTVVAGVTGVFITWNTIYNTTSQVDYGLTTASNASFLNPTLTNYHVVMLTGLIPDTNYVFQARSMTAAMAATDVTNGSIVTIMDGAPAVLYTTNGTFSTTSSLTFGTHGASYGGGWALPGSDAVGIYGGVNSNDFTYEYVQGVAVGSPTASATYTPTIAVPGLYDISIWYPTKPGFFSASTPMIAIGTTNVVPATVNQTINGGSWQPLVTGMYFASGASGNLTIYNDSGDTTTSVVANGARWVYEVSQDNPASGTVPAWWADFYFGGNVSGAATGLNGYAYYADYVLGTDPTSSSSQLQFVAAPGPSTNVTVTFAPWQGGRVYQLQSSGALGNPAWVTLTNTPALNTNNGSGFFTVGQTPGATVFYRLAASLAPTQ
ncbi:MAG: hypothetical protein ABSG78_23080 [Verrucomicrobiota bacterium]